MFQVQFRQVDVFTSVPFKGNPVAVVMDARELSCEQMQAIARWTNLSETTFVLPASHQNADYKLRIFTPGSELPFAGHPTIGSAYALLESGVIHAKNERIVQECAAGLVELSVSQNELGATSIAFELPQTTITLLTEPQIAKLEMILGISLDRKLTPALVDVGARWIVAHTSDVQMVLNTQPDFAALREHDLDLSVTGVCLYAEYPDTGSASIEVRSFAPACGVNEDPVCGSGNGSVAAFMRYHGVRLPENGLVCSSQGKMLTRDGKLHLQISNEKIWVGGQAVTCIEGIIRF